MHASNKVIDFMPEEWANNKVFSRHVALNPAPANVAPLLNFANCTGCTFNIYNK